MRCHHRPLIQAAHVWARTRKLSAVATAPVSDAHCWAALDAGPPSQLAKLWTAAGQTDICVLPGCGELCLLYVPAGLQSENACRITCRTSGTAAHIMLTMYQAAAARDTAS